MFWKLELAHLSCTFKKLAEQEETARNVCAGVYFLFLIIFNSKEIIWSEEEGI